VAPSGRDDESGATEFVQIKAIPAGSRQAARQRAQRAVPQWALQPARQWIPEATLQIAQHWAQQ